jgi:glutamate racemase
MKFPANSLPTFPIGIFDSGIGGLSVLRAIRRLAPSENLLYLGDQIHVPYGLRPMEQIQGFSREIARFLLEQGAKLIVVACNTASAAALVHLRGIFPEVSFVGMEPAVKPAAETTRTGRVGILATPATFQGALYASVVERFGSGVEFYQHTCPGLVDRIERGELEGRATRAILEEALLPMLDRNIDTVVLGCTHYPFVIPLIREIAGENVRVIDPGPAVARQAGRLLEAGKFRNPDRGAGSLRFYTSSNPHSMEEAIFRLIGETATVGRVTWGEDGRINPARGS